MLPRFDPTNMRAAGEVTQRPIPDLKAMPKGGI